METLYKKLSCLCDMEQEILDEIAKLCRKLEYIHPEQLRGANELCASISKTPISVKKEILVCKGLEDLTKIYTTHMKYGVAKSLATVLFYPFTYLKQIYKIHCNDYDVIIDNIENKIKEAEKLGKDIESIYNNLRKKRAPDISARHPLLKVYYDRSELEFEGL